MSRNVRRRRPVRPHSRSKPGKTCACCNEDFKPGDKIVYVPDVVLANPDAFTSGTDTCGDCGNEYPVWVPAEGCHHLGVCQVCNNLAEWR